MAQSNKPKQGKRAPAYSADSMAVCLIVGLVLIALGLLILFSAVTKVDGDIFRILRLFSGGMAGTLSFALAAIPIWGGVLVFISTQRKPPVRPFVLGCLLMLLLCTTVTLMTYIRSGTSLMDAVRNSVVSDGISANSYTAYLSDAFEFGSGARRNDSRSIGGGLLGMLLAWPLWKGFGSIGGGVIAILLAIVVFLFLIRLDVKGLSASMRQSAEAGAARREEKRALREQEALARQQQAEYARQQQEALARQQQEEYARQQALAQQQAMAAQNAAAAAPMRPAPAAPMPADVPDPWNVQPSSVANWNQTYDRSQQPDLPPPVQRVATPKPPRKPIGFQPETEPTGSYAAPSDMPPAGERKGLFQRKRNTKPVDEETPATPAKPRRSLFSRASEAEDTVPGEVTGPTRRPRKADVVTPPAEPAPAVNVAEEEEEFLNVRPEPPVTDTRKPTRHTGPHAPVQPEPAPVAPAEDFAAPAQPEPAARTPRAGSFMARLQARDAAKEAAGAEASAPARSTRKDTPSAWSDPEGDAGSASWREEPAPARPSTRSRAQNARQKAPEVPVAPAPAPSWDETPPWEEPAAPVQPEVPAPQPAPRKVHTTQMKDGAFMQTLEDPSYMFPSMDLLATPKPQVGIDPEEDQRRSHVLENTLQSFKVPAKVRHITHGPAISRFELELAPGVRVSKVTDLNRNIAMNLAVKSVRIEAPIPGKSLVGVEVPNKQRATVTLREVLESEPMRKANKPLVVALGKDIAGTPIVCDLAKMPHLLIAGATGSGKSVCINTIINSLLYRCSPKEVRLILVDPKVVELQCYNGIPHLLIPVVSDPHKASGALAWAVGEMMDRYKRFQEAGVRNIEGFNEQMGEDDKMPRLVIVIDELADLMMTCKKDVEERICRLAQLARAAGIHLIVATQRPSVDVITGLIKANIPSRIAFKVTSNVDSRTILDRPGAEQLLGYGDMLYMPTGEFTPVRVQGCFLSDDEVNRITDFIRETCPGTYDPEILEALERAQTESDGVSLPDPSSDDDYVGGDGSLLMQAIEMAVNDGQVSTSLIQRRLRLGYARAGRLVDEMERRGIVSQKDGAKPRLCLITREEFEIMKDNGDFD